MIMIPDAKSVTGTRYARNLNQYVTKAPKTVPPYTSIVKER